VRMVTFSSAKCLRRIHRRFQTRGAPRNSRKHPTIQKRC
jgi:hypothetical protein